MSDSALGRLRISALSAVRNRLRARSKSNPAVDLAEEERRLAVATLASIISHDLASPLMCLRGLLQYGNLGAEDQAAVSDEIERISSLSQKLRTMRFDFGPDDWSNAREITLNALEHVQAIEVKHLDVNLNIAPSEMIFMNASALHLLLVSLLRNAAEAAPPKGNLMINLKTEHAFELRLKNEGALSPSLLSRMFEPLSGAAPQGRGLGFSVIQRISQKYGWTLNVIQGPTSTEFCLTGAVPQPSDR